MKVSDLISSLEYFKEKQGDLEVMREGNSGGPQLVVNPVLHHLTTSEKRFWDSRINTPASKGKKVCVL